MLEQIDLLCAELNLAKQTSEKQQNCKCPWTIHEYIKKVQSRNRYVGDEEKLTAVQSSKYEIVRKILSGVEIITDDEIKELNEDELQEVISELLLTHEENSRDSSEIIENCYVPKCTCTTCHCKDNFKEILQENVNEMTVKEVHETSSEDDYSCHAEKKACNLKDVPQLTNKFADIQVVDTNRVSYCKDLENIENIHRNICGSSNAYAVYPDRIPLEHEMTVEEVEDDYASVSEVLWYFKKSDQDESIENCPLSESVQTVGEFNSDQVLMMQEINLQPSLLSLSSQQNLDDDMSPRRLFINKYLNRTYPKMGIDASVQTSIEKLKIQDVMDSVSDEVEKSSSDSCECLDKTKSVENVMDEIVAESVLENDKLDKEREAIKDIERCESPKLVKVNTDVISVEKNSLEKISSEKSTTFQEHMYLDENSVNLPLLKVAQNEKNTRQYVSDFTSKKKVRICDPKTHIDGITCETCAENLQNELEGTLFLNEENCHNHSIGILPNKSNESLTKNIKSALKNSSKESVSKNSSCSSKKSVEFEPTILEQSAPKFKPLSLETLPECLRPLSRSMEDMKNTTSLNPVDVPSPMETQERCNSKNGENRCFKNDENRSESTSKSLTEVDGCQNCNKDVSPCYLTKMDNLTKFESNAFAGYAFTSEPNVLLQEVICKNMNKKTEMKWENVNCLDSSVLKESEVNIKQDYDGKYETEKSAINHINPVSSEIITEETIEINSDSTYEYNREKIAGLNTIINEKCEDKSVILTDDNIMSQSNPLFALKKFEVSKETHKINSEPFNLRHLAKNTMQSSDSFSNKTGATYKSEFASNLNSEDLSCNTNKSDTVMLSAHSTPISHMNNESLSYNCGENISQGSATFLFQSDLMDNFSADPSCITDEGISSSAVTFLNKIQEKKNKKNSVPSLSLNRENLSCGANALLIKKKKSRPFSAKISDNKLLSATSCNKSTDSALPTSIDESLLNDNCSFQKRLKSTENKMSFDPSMSDCTMSNHECTNLSNEEFNTEIIEIYKTSLEDNIDTPISNKEHETFENRCIIDEIRNEDCHLIEATSSMLSAQKKYYQEKILKTVADALQVSKQSCNPKCNDKNCIMLPGIRKQSDDDIETEMSVNSSENIVSNISSEMTILSKDSGSIKSPNNSDEIICFCPSLGSMICDSSKKSVNCSNNKVMNCESCNKCSSKSEDIYCINCKKQLSNTYANELSDVLFNGKQEDESRSISIPQNKNFTSESNCTETTYNNAEADYYEESFEYSELSPNCPSSHECTDFTDDRSESSKHLNTESCDLSTSTQSINVGNNKKSSNDCKRKCLSCIIPSDNSGLDYYMPGIASENALSDLRRHNHHSLSDYRSFCFLPIDVYAVRPPLDLSTFRNAYYPSVATQTLGDRMMDLGDGLRMEGIESETDSDL